MLPLSSSKFTSLHIHFHNYPKLLPSSGLPSQGLTMVIPSLLIATLELSNNYRGQHNFVHQMWADLHLAEHAVEELADDEAGHEVGEDCHGLPCGASLQWVDLRGHLLIALLSPFSNPSLGQR